MVKIDANTKIVGNVRFINGSGDPLIVDINQAMNSAKHSGLDLVILDDKAEIPVVKTMDYGKFIYEKTKKEKKNRKTTIHLKEVKFHVNIDKHDLDIKVNRIIKFLDKGDRVKISVQFRGRENAHKEFGTKLIRDVIKTIGDKCKVDTNVSVQGRNAFAVINPA